MTTDQVTAAIDWFGPEEASVYTPTDVEKWDGIHGAILMQLVGELGEALKITTCTCSPHALRIAEAALALLPKEDK